MLLTSTISAEVVYGAQKLMLHPAQPRSRFPCLPVTKLDDVVNLVDIG